MEVYVTPDGNANIMLCSFPSIAERFCSGLGGKPTRGIEPLTYGLRNHYSAIAG